MSLTSIKHARTCEKCRCIFQWARNLSATPLLQYRNPVGAGPSSNTCPLLRTLQEKYRLAYLFISHDLRVVRAMAHEILVLKDGKVMESGPSEQVFENPKEDYTRMLLDAALLRN